MASSIPAFVNAGFQTMAGIQQLRAAKESKRAAKNRAEAATNEIAAQQLASVTQQAALTRNAIEAGFAADAELQSAERRADDVRLIADQINGSAAVAAAASGDVISAELRQIGRAHV